MKFTKLFLMSVFSCSVLLTACGFDSDDPSSSNDDPSNNADPSSTPTLDDFQVSSDNFNALIRNYGFLVNKSVTYDSTITIKNSIDMLYYCKYEYDFEDMKQTVSYSNSTSTNVYYMHFYKNSNPIDSDIYHLNDKGYWVMSKSSGYHDTFASSGMTFGELKFSDFNYDETNHKYVLKEAKDFALDHSGTFHYDGLSLYFENNQLKKIEAEYTFDGMNAVATTIGSKWDNTSVTLPARGPQPGPSPVPYVPGNPVKVGLICLHDSNSSTMDKVYFDCLQEAVNNLGSDKVNLTPDCILTHIGENQECIDAAKNLILKGCDVIFADAYGHSDFLYEVATQYPDITFVPLAGGYHGYNATIDNYLEAYASINEGRYLSGYATGLKLATDTSLNFDTGFKLGFVGAYPYANVVSAYTAYYLGVKEALRNMGKDPSKVIMDVRYAMSWYSPTDEANLAQLLCNDGVVALSQYSDSMGVPSASNVINFSYNVDTREFAPPGIALGYSAIDWSVIFEEVISSIYEDRDTTDELNHNYTARMSDDAIICEVNWDLYPQTSRAECQTLFANEKQALIDGTKKVFDVSKFTMDTAMAATAGATLDSSNHVTSYTVDLDGDYLYDDQQVITTDSVTGITYFNESYYISFPYFDLRINGINELGLY